MGNSELHVSGAEIIPEATYEVQMISEICDPGLAGNFSDALVTHTGVFGDNVRPFFDEQPHIPQPNFNDIAGAVAKFLATPGAPNKTSAQLQPNRVFPDRPVDFRDIGNTINGFVAVPYSSLFVGPCLCPSAVTCGATACFSDSECAGDGLCLDGFCTDACGRCSP